MAKGRDDHGASVPVAAYGGLRRRNTFGYRAGEAGGWLLILRKCDIGFLAGSARGPG
jgi:hypothetical protein